MLVFCENNIKNINFYEIVPADLAILQFFKRTSEDVVLSGNFSFTEGKNIGHENPIFKLGDHISLVNMILLHIL